MVILGLGSNMGDRLENLRKALKAIRALKAVVVQQVSPVYVSDALLPDNAPPDWDMPHLNLAIRLTTHLEPLALLKELKNIEWSIGRKPEARHWGPRILDIDILAWDQQMIESDVLTVPHANLPERPFAFWPLADVAPLWKFPLPGPNHGKPAAQIVEVWGSRFTGEAPFRTRQINQRIDTPQLVGIINVTPDSFSDGGKFLNPEIAAQQAEHLVTAGADILDIGAESTSPSAQKLNEEIEWERLEPVLVAIKAAQTNFFIKPKISIDTRHAQVAKKALAIGVDWINDVSGLDDPAMREIIAAANVDVVVMHHLSIPERRDRVLARDADPVKVVYEWGEKRLAELEKQGIARSRVIFDPGVGFGKMAEQSLVVLKHVTAFKELGTRIHIGFSRKTFFSLMTNQPFADRDIETLAATLTVAREPVDYIRLHNVEMCARGIRVMQALQTIS